MKKTSLLLIIFLSIGIALVPKGAAKAATTITTCEQLQDMSLNLAEDYVLGNDIDCSATTGWNGGAGFAPVGNDTTPFTGSLDGQNHKIIGLFIDRPTTDYVGLFGGAINSSISNIVMDTGSIKGQAYVGSLVGSMQSMNLNNVSSDISIESTGRFAGGIVGWNANQATFLSTLTNVHFKGSVNGPGGYWGYGGLIGDNDANVDIIKSSNTGTITGGNGDDCIGGLIGDNDLTVNITESFNSGAIESNGINNGWIGGLIGWSETANITNSYNSGNITGNTRAGGLVGYTNLATTIIKSYSSGLITSPNAATSGALIGIWRNLTMNNTFWNTETSGQTVPCGTDDSCTESAVGITSAQMRTQSTFTDDTWDFSNVWAICPSFNNGFPYLQWQNPSCTPPAPTPGLPNTGSSIMNINYSNTWAIENLLKF